MYFRRENRRRDELQRERERVLGDLERIAISMEREKGDKASFWRYVV